MDFQEPEYFSKQIHVAKRFYRQPTDPSSYPAVIAGGRELCAPGYRIEDRTIPYFTLEFVSAGKGRLELAGKEYTIDPGTIFFYGPEQKHSIRIAEAERLEKYFVNVLPHQSIKDSEFLGRVLHTSRPQSILLSFEELIEYGLDPSPLSEIIYSRIFSLILDKTRASALEHGEIVSPAYRNFRRCKSVIGANFLRITNVETASETCGVSTPYLCRLFSRYDHQSPYRYLMGLRMIHAADLMLSRGLSVKETAAEMGYEDQGHFSRTFKRIIGCSPSQLGA